MSNFQTIKELFQLMWEKKLWWMVPMVVIFLLVGILLVVAGSGSAFSPFIYALF
jgi:fluoride ion exporter CrcB/FEX